jgi:hypothetical protein
MPLSSLFEELSRIGQKGNPIGAIQTILLGALPELEIPAYAGIQWLDKAFEWQSLPDLSRFFSPYVHDLMNPYPSPAMQIACKEAEHNPNIVMVGSGCRWAFVRRAALYACQQSRVISPGAVENAHKQEASADQIIGWTKSYQIQTHIEGVTAGLVVPTGSDIEKALSNHMICDKPLQLEDCWLGNVTESNKPTRTFTIHIGKMVLK